MCFNDYQINVWNDSGQTSRYQNTLNVQLLHKLNLTAVVVLMEFNQLILSHDWLFKILHISLHLGYNTYSIMYTDYIIHMLFYLDKHVLF